MGADRGPIEAPLPHLSPGSGTLADGHRTLPVLLADLAAAELCSITQRSIVGSANLNYRSLEDDGDFEACVFVEGETPNTNMSNKSNGDRTSIS